MRIMRKSINILLSILLSILIVWIGSGIMTMVCEHTGNVSLAQQMEKKNCKNSDAKHCMKMQIKTLSPTNTAQTVTHQFHPVQLSLLPQLTTSCDFRQRPQRRCCHCFGIAHHGNIFTFLQCF